MCSLNLVPLSSIRDRSFLEHNLALCLHCGQRKQILFRRFILNYKCGLLIYIAYKSPELRRTEVGETTGSFIMQLSQCLNTKFLWYVEDTVPNLPASECWTPALGRRHQLDTRAILLPLVATEKK